MINSCDVKEDYVQIQSEVVEASGEWWIKFANADVETGYLKVHTFNTADDVATEFWISDLGNWKDVMIKCNFFMFRLSIFNVICKFSN